MQDSQYKRVKNLGEGGYGPTYLVRDVKDGSLWVQKQISKTQMTEQEKIKTYNKFKIFQQLKHPNIIKFRDVYITTERILCIITEYAERGSLGQIIKSQNGKQFTEDQILDWFTQICLALKHVHDKNILHRDLNLTNIYITKKNSIQLGDFLIAKVLQHTLEKAKTQIGTPYYLSPEIIESKPYSFPNDIWALGTLLYELCMLEPPFQADHLHDLCLKIIKGTFNDISSNYSTDLNYMIRSLLKCNPEKRPTIDQILKIPLISKRVNEYKSQSNEQNEFTPKILDKQRLSKDNNITELDDQIRLPKKVTQQQRRLIISHVATPVKTNHSTMSQNTLYPSQPKQLQQTETPQTSKRETSFNSQVNQKQKKRNTSNSKIKISITSARSESKKKDNQVQSIIQIPQVNKRQQQEQSQQKPKLIKNASQRSLQFKKTVPQVQQKNNYVPLDQKDQQYESSQKNSQLINNVSLHSLQLREPLQKPQLQYQFPQQQLKQQQSQLQTQSYEDFNEYDDTELEEAQIYYGINFESSFDKNSNKNAKMKKELIENDDEFEVQFEKTKNDIMDSKVYSDISVKDQELENSQETVKTESKSSQSSFIGKSNRALQLKILLEQVLGVNKTRQTIKILRNQLTIKSLKDLEKYRLNFYQNLLPFLSTQECKKFVPLIFELIEITK